MTTVTTSIKQQHLNFKRYPSLCCNYKGFIVIAIVLWIVFMIQQATHIHDILLLHQHNNNVNSVQYHHLLQQQQERVRCTSYTNSDSKLLSKRVSPEEALILSSDTTTTTTTTTRYSSCAKEWNRLITRIPTTTTASLTIDDYERSIAHVGNRYRMKQFVTKLIQSSSTTVSVSSKNDNKPATANNNNNQGVTVIVCGASITIGHGVEPKEARYLNLLENWLNSAYPMNDNVVEDGNDNGSSKTTRPRPQHNVHFRGGHGASICAMAKRIKFIKLPNNVVPDLFILEFAVNNYQAEDHNTFVDHKTNVYFDGFTNIVQCTEIVIGRILLLYPNTAIIFLDLHTAIPNRKTAQSLHVGVAQHYQIPVLSYADMMMPDYFRLIETLQPYNYFLPNFMIDIINHTFPYPHGCSPCRFDDMTEQFRVDGCWSICDVLKQGGGGLLSNLNCERLPSDTQQCYVPMYDHDEVHLSKVGHGIARDVLVHYISNIAYDICVGHGNQYQPHILPIHGGWIIGSDQSVNDANSDMKKSYLDKIMVLSDFVFVQDVKFNFADVPPLVPKYHTSGFEIVTDYLSRKGWVADNKLGNEVIQFEIKNIPIEKCYAIYITVLKSYKTVGTFNVSIYDHQQQKVTKTSMIDCLWKPHISVPIDVQLTFDGSTDCMGECDITITTNPQSSNDNDRGGNLIKITSLSARRCV